jgi:hypothetical protein
VKKMCTLFKQASVYNESRLRRLSLKERNLIFTRNLTVNPEV